MWATVSAVLSLTLCLLFTSHVTSQQSSQYTVAEFDSLLDTNKEFALQMYQYATIDAQNVFLSPYSITSALGMLYIGSRGTTESTMAAQMGFTSPKATTLPMFEMMHALLNRPEASYVLKEANRVYPDREVQLLQSYSQRCDEVFGADIETVDMANVYDTVTTINSWVRDQTEGYIDNLLKQNDIDANSAMVLVNALYFLATWEHPFDPDDTQPGTFTGPNNVQTTIQFMQQTQRLYTGYSGVLGAQVLRLPYTDPTVSMYVFLPDQNNQDPLDDLEDMESALSNSTVTDAIGSLTEQMVQVTFPKFNITHQQTLNDVLAGVGLDIIYDADQADFSGIDDGVNDLVVSNCIHQAFIAVDEIGTTAAAATAVILSRRLPMSITVDRPFFFIIHAHRNNTERGSNSDADTGRGTILFMGRVADPGSLVNTRSDLSLPNRPVNYIPPGQRHSENRTDTEIPQTTEAPPGGRGWLNLPDNSGSVLTGKAWLLTCVGIVGWFLERML